MLARRVDRWFHGRAHNVLRYESAAHQTEFQIGDIRWSVTTSRPGATVHWLDEHPEDKLELEIFVKLAQSAEGILFDVGANVGSFVVLFCKVSRHGAVAFEPSAAASKLIHQNATLNGISSERIRIIEAAAAAEHGTAEMHVDERTGFAQGVDNHDSDFAARSTLKVETTTVDAARKADGRKVALLKIDVEGFEDQVLQGSRDTLSRDRPTVFLELHHNVLRDRGVSSHKMFDSLARLRYSLIRLNGKPVNLGAAVAAGSLMPRAHVLAVPCEQSSLLRASMRLRR